MKSPNLSFPVLTIVPFLLWFVGGCGGPPAAPAAVSRRSVPAHLLVVQRSEVAETYQAVGTVEPTLRATLASKVTGRVAAVGAREGDPVAAGRPLVWIDARELASSVVAAEAGYRASVVDVASARVNAEVADESHRVAVRQAQAQITQARAALAAAEARRDLAVAGRRTQEIAQSRAARTRAESDLHLATLELERTQQLVQEGALAQRELDLAQNRFDAAKAACDISMQTESATVEGSRSQEIREAQEAVRQAQAGLDQARAALNQAEVTALQTRVKRQAVDVAIARMHQSEQQVQSARVGESYAAVTAPFAGRVVRRLVDPGAMALPGSPLVEIEGGELRLEVSVPEGLLARVARGASVSVHLDAQGDVPLVGHVREVVPHGDEASHTFRVKIGLPPSQGVKSGMFGRAEIRKPAVAQIRIPVSATWDRDGLHYVMAVDPDHLARLRIVTVGSQTEGQVEILSGLNPGDLIVGGDPSRIQDGDRVEAKRP